MRGRDLETHKQYKSDVQIISLFLPNSVLYTDAVPRHVYLHLLPSVELHVLTFAQEVV